MRGFVHACLGSEIDRGDLETMIAFNCMTPQFTSLALTLRKAIDFTPIISSLDIPILATYGTKDSVALPIAGEHIVTSCRNASSSFYEGVGHAPFRAARALQPRACRIRDEGGAWKAVRDQLGCHAWK